MEAGENFSALGSLPKAKGILIIDDDDLNLKLISHVLTRAGFRVRIARSAEEGLTLLQEERPNLILMDLRLSGMDGLEATRRIKGNPSLASIPIVAVSAYAMEEDFSRAAEAGCSGYLTKPFEMKEILETVRRYAAD